MEEKYRCEECNKEFSTEEGLKQHMRDKHGVGVVTSHELKEQKKKERELIAKQEREKSQRSKMTRKILLYGGAFLLLSGVIYAIVVLTQNPGPRLADEDYILRTNLRTHSGIGMHIHPHLAIKINGENVEIPAEIGISGGVMSVIHTHDATGTLHLEAPTPKDFNVGHFFFMWSHSSGDQKIFNSTCILDYCNDGVKQVKMFVNDVESNEYENHIMRDLERIEIRYE